MKLLLFFHILLSAGLPFELGVNSPNLFKFQEVEGNEEQTLQNQYAKIDRMYDAGCRELRLSITDFKYTERVRKHILYANGKGMYVTVDFLGVDVYPEGTKRLQPIGPPRRHGGWPTHEMDLSLVRKRMRCTLADWKKAGCRIQAIEVGNETGWCEFNGDFPLMPEGEGVLYDSSYTWQTLPENVPDGIRKMAEATRITKRIVDRLWLFSKDKPLVIVGGLNLFHNMSWCRKVGGTIMRPEMVLQIYKGTLPGQPQSRNLLKFADGVGVHMYPQISVSDDYAAKYAGVLDCIKGMMEPLSKETELPMYVTEVGLRYAGDENEKGRIEAFEALFQAYSDTDAQYDWRLVQIYCWDGNENHIFVKPDGELLPSSVIFSQYSKRQ